jgi:hypothetical protein
MRAMCVAAIVVLACVAPSALGEYKATADCIVSKELKFER